jgi:ribosomal protein S11
MFYPVALFLTTAGAMLGWYLAWKAKGDVAKAKDAEALAVAGEHTARDAAFEANARCITATTQLSALEGRMVQLQHMLDAERESRQALVNALAQSGLPIGDIVVDSALDRLYPDEGDPSGSTGAGTRPGGRPVVVSSPSARAPSSPAKS